MVRFGSFAIDTRTWTLTRNGAPLDLSRRLVEILAYLVERDGAVATKEELLDRFWPDVHVTENTLTRAIADIRKTVGDDRRWCTWREARGAGQMAQRAPALCCRMHSLTAPCCRRQACTGCAAWCWREWASCLKRARRCCARPKLRGPGCTGGSFDGWRQPCGRSTGSLEVTRRRTPRSFAPRRWRGEARPTRPSNS